METPKQPQKNEAVARALRELRTSDSWMILTDELSRIRMRLESEILDMPMTAVDNTIRYTRLDLLREMRRMVGHFIDLPDDMITILEGGFEESM